MTSRPPLVLVNGELKQLPATDNIPASSLDLTGVATLAQGNNADSFRLDVNRFGFLNQTETTLAFDGVNLFTLGSVGASWSYYRGGIKYTITGAKTLTVATPMVDAALYFIYIDATDGTLTASTSAWTLLDTKVPVATLYWNSTLTPKFVLSEERHSVLIDRRMHFLHHFDVGTRMQSVGALSGYTINTDTNASKTFAIAASVLMDEDIIQTLAGLTQPNGTATDYAVMYRTAAATWAWKSSNMPFAYNVGNTNNWIQWDNAGTMTDATGGAGGSVRWVNSYLLFTNVAGTMRHVLIPGRAIFTTLALAQAETPSAFTFTGFPCAEFVAAYQLTWTTVTSTSQGQCRLAAAPVKIAVAAINTALSGAGIDHETLAGLQGGAIGDHKHLTSAELLYLQTLSFQVDGGTASSNYVSGQLIDGGTA